MARFAGLVGEVERHNVSSAGHDLVALGATDGGVAAFEWEPGLAVPRENEVRRSKTIYRVAVFAAVLVRCARELAFVRVGVAVQAELEFDAVQRRFAGWTVALCAG